MKLNFRFLPLLFISSLAQSADPPVPPSAQADQLLAFACDLYRPHAARTASAENFAFSPVNLAQVCEVLTEISSGETRNQLAAALHHEGPQEAWSPNGLLPIPDPASGLVLKQATGLWAAENFPLKEDIAPRLQQKFGAVLDKADFAQAPLATGKINDWISGQTEQRIPNLLPPGLLNKQTRLVAASALFFQGQWVSKFDPAQTKPGKFTPATGEKITTPLMHGAFPARYAVWPDGTKALAMDFNGAPLSFWAILPNEAKGDLAALEAGLTPRLLHGLDQQMKRQTVTITLPKFTLRSEFPAQPMLKSLGVSDLFDTADFTPLTAESDLALSALLHQVTFQCDESGAEVAAATAGVIVSKSANSATPAVFTADRPFVFLIVQNDTLAPLIIGRCGKPKTAAVAVAPVTVKDKSTKTVPAPTPKKSGKK